ncbi:MAG: dienelactone hydrolase family protein [Nitrospirales bacterium]|nr:dienelactone hydrolase family protein [Nitrospirales bacterium]
MNTPHNGRNKGTEPVSLIAIYTGEKGSPTTKKIRGNRIEYTADGIAMKGYLAYDERFRGKRPGVLVVPEWWGNNEYARRRAIMLAEIGYAALVVDMYGDGRVAETPDEAGKLAAEATKAPETAKSRFIAAMNLLKQQPVVDPQRIGAIGYCFGGGVVLNIAKQGVDLKGVVSFHGSMPKGEPAKAGAVRAKLLVLHGGADTAVKPEQVEAFKKEMTEAGADFRLITYPGAKHSFTNAEADRYAAKFHLPAGYNREADEKSWKEMKLFLKEVFRTQDRQ